MSGSSFWLDVVLKTPLEEWKNLGNLVHRCCQDAKLPLVVLLRVIQAGCDLNEISRSSNTPAHEAVHWNCVAELEMLCAAGANMRILNRQSYSPLDYAICFRRDECVRVLLLYGMTLNFLHGDTMDKVTPEARALYSHVVSVRAKAIILLGIKRRRRLAAWIHIDKFLIREMAFSIWALRKEGP